MSGPNLINVMCLLSAVLILGLSVPLLLEKIGPNGLYGFRTERTKSDPKIWYAVNKIFGRNLLIAALIMLLTSVGMIALGGHLELLVVIAIETAVSVIGLGLAIGLAAAALRRM